MTSSWRSVRLREVLRKGEEWVLIDPERDYREVTVRLWGKGAVLRRIARGAEIAAGRRLRVRAGQFILSRIDARNGAVGIVPADLDGAVVSNDFPSFDVDRSRLLPTFLGWMAKTTSFVDRCRAASEGTTNRVRIQEARFLDDAIPLPSLEEQRRIVAKLDGVGARVGVITRLRAELAAELGRLSTSLHMDASSGPSVPLGEYLAFEEHQEPVAQGLEYPQVGIRGFGGGLFPKPAVCAADTTYRAFNKLFVGAVVLSQVKGWEGAIDVCPTQLSGYFASPEYRTFRCREGILHPEYAARIFKTEWFLGRLSTLSRGVGARRERTRPEAFLSLQIPMPTYGRQCELLPALQKVAQLKRDGDHAQSHLVALMPSLLDRAFRGEL